MSTLTLAEGAIFAGRYRIVRSIAVGGMGAVYEVTHIETARRRALKVMLPHFVQSQELRDRFRQEAQVAAHIESEFIVDVFDAGIDEETQMPFLVMELLRGEEIGQRLRRVGRFSPMEVVTYLHQTGLALDRTHLAKIVHRDLKPENLYLTQREDGAPRIKVLDFGIAKVVAESGTNVNATRSIGTPLYMAPEQFRPGHRVSSATDLYALGMMTYTLLVGSAYWREESTADSNVFAFASAVMNGPQEPATERARRAGVTLPAAFDAWFAQATALEPSARFPSCSSLVPALAAALGVPAPGAALSSVHDLGGAPTPTVVLEPAALASIATGPGTRPNAATTGPSAAATGSNATTGSNAVTTGQNRASMEPSTISTAPNMAAGRGGWGMGKAAGIGAAIGVCAIGVGGVILVLGPRTSPALGARAPSAEAATIQETADATTAQAFTASPVTQAPNVNAAKDSPAPAASPIAASPSPSAAPSAAPARPEPQRPAALPPQPQRPTLPAVPRKTTLHVRD